MEPRIPPVSLGDAAPEAREVLERFSRLRGDDASVLNVFGTLAVHPTLFRKWLTFANYVLTQSTLDPRLRELAILRIGWHCHAPYEWGQHIVVGRREGLTDEQIARVAVGPDAPGWSELEALVLRATDELHEHSTVTTATYTALGTRFSDQQVLDLVFTVGQYVLVSYALNAAAVARDDGVDETALPFPPAANDLANP